MFSIKYDTSMNIFYRYKIIRFDTVDLIQYNDEENKENDDDDDNN